jgi:hypothetical protein
MFPERVAFMPREHTESRRDNGNALSMIGSPLRSGRGCAIMHMYVPYGTASAVPRREMT